MGLLTTKPVAVLEAEAELSGDADAAVGLRRVLGAADLTLLGVGAIVGLGGVALTGYLASRVAGPAVTLSFALAAAACILAALCFAELASMLPSTGGPYAWSYAALGELPAWLVGWCLLLEYVLGGATVAMGWARHLTLLARDAGVVLPAALRPGAGPGTFGPGVGVLAALLVAVLSLALLAGVRAAVRLNAALAVAKLAALLAVIVGGALAVDPANWRPFVPPSDAAGGFGWGGVLRASSMVFFAYLGFDAIAVAAGEARRPRRDVPRAMLRSLGCCAVLYVVLALVVTGARRFGPSALADPTSAVVATAGESPVLLLLVRLGLNVGLAGVVLVLLLAAARVVFAMSRDGMLPAGLGRVAPGTGAPGPATVLVGALAAAAVLLAPVDRIGDVVTTGALLVFVAVCASLVVLRRRRPELARPFRVPAGAAVATLGGLVALALLVDAARHRPAPVALALFVGLVLYFAYGHAHSRVRRVAGARQ